MVRLQYTAILCSRRLSTLLLEVIGLQPPFGHILKSHHHANASTIRYGHHYDQRSSTGHAQMRRKCSIVYWSLMHASFWLSMLLRASDCRATGLVTDSKVKSVHLTWTLTQIWHCLAIFFSYYLNRMTLFLLIFDSVWFGTILRRKWLSLRRVEWEECERWSSTNQKTSVCSYKSIMDLKRRMQTVWQKKTSFKLKQHKIYLRITTSFDGGWTDRRERSSPSPIMSLCVAAHLASRLYFGIWLAPPNLNPAPPAPDQWPTWLHLGQYFLFYVLPPSKNGIDNPISTKQKQKKKRLEHKSFDILLMKDTMQMVDLFAVCEPHRCLWLPDLWRVRVEKSWNSS